MAERCVQQYTGSCGGCPVQEILVNKIERDPELPRREAAAKIAEVYCPVGTAIQVPERVKQSIW